MDNTKPVYITNYKELLCPDATASIYNFIKKKQTVDELTIKYLQTKHLFCFSPGVYQHPFNKNIILAGPYLYTDGKFVWDRDTWKYVLKYGLVLPEEFISYVHSAAGKTFLENQTSSKNESLHFYRPSMNLLPSDAGDLPLEEF